MDEKPTFCQLVHPALQLHRALWCHHFMLRIILVATVILLFAIVGSGTDEELPTRTVSLHYPCAALQNRIQGAVRLRCAIGNDGICSEVKPIVGHPLLLKDAIDNLRKWRYSPGTNSAQRPRSALVQYRFVIGAARKSKFDDDVVVTFDSPNTVTVVAPFDGQVPCQYELVEAPIR